MHDVLEEDSQETRKALGVLPQYWVDGAVNNVLEYPVFASLRRLPNLPGELEIKMRDNPILQRLLWKLWNGDYHLCKGMFLDLDIWV